MSSAGFKANADWQQANNMQDSVIRRTITYRWGELVRAMRGPILSYPMPHGFTFPGRQLASLNRVTDASLFIVIDITTAREVASPIPGLAQRSGLCVEAPHLFFSSSPRL